MNAAPVARLVSTRISERDNVAFTSAEPQKPEPWWVARAASVRNRWEKEAYRPNHVKVCANNPHSTGRWTIAVWPKANPVQVTMIPYCCSSWRCPSVECQRAQAHRDFARIKEAVDGHDLDAKKWVSMVLTIDQNETLAQRASKNGWSDIQEAYRALSKMARNFKARMKRMHKERGWDVSKWVWVESVEAQRSGWPHTNLMLYSPDYAEFLRENPTHNNYIMGEVLEHAVACDWGTISTAEPVRDLGAMSGYLVKVAGNLDRGVGEMAKLSQLPVVARMKLRRIRASKGFLKSPPKNGSFTGIMLKRGHTYTGAPMVDTLMQPESVRCPEHEQEAYLLGVRTALALELERYKAETAGESVKVVSRYEDRAKVARKVMRDAQIVSVLRVLENVSNIGESKNERPRIRRIYEGNEHGTVGNAHGEGAQCGALGIRANGGDYLPDRGFRPMGRRNPDDFGKTKAKHGDDFGNDGHIPRPGDDRRAPGGEIGGISPPSEQCARARLENSEGLRNLPGMPEEIQRPRQGLQLVRINSGPPYGGHANKHIIDKGKKQ